jgi:flavin-dependent dehydrogenase
MCEQPGYLWSFPRPDHLAVGVCAAATCGVSSPQLRGQSLAWIHQHRLDHDARLTPYAWPIPSIGGAGGRADVFGGRGWMLLGDAAGLVDPLTREGIYFALLSGLWAAEALTTGSPERAATAYSSRIRAELQPEFALAARFGRLFFSPAFSGLMVRALGESASIRQVFADLVGGVQPYRTLRRRLLATRHWTLAIRMLAPVFADKMNLAHLSRDT